MPSKNIWIQAATKLQQLVKLHLTDSALIAGSFGESEGGDLDALLVFRADAHAAFSDFLAIMREELIIPYQAADKQILPFRFTSSRPYTTTSTLSSLRSAPEFLPLHLLIYPDPTSFVRWEDHEIIRQMLDGLEKPENLWLGSTEDLERIRDKLISKDYIGRRYKYQEMLLSAYQDAVFANGDEEIRKAQAQAGYAARYLAADEALLHFGKVTTSKAQVLDYLQTEGRPGISLIKGDSSTRDELCRQILDAFEYWNTVRPKQANEGVPPQEVPQEIADVAHTADTPTLLVSRSILEKRLSECASAFAALRKPIEVAYAVKANGMLPVVSRLSEAGYGGFCVTSYSDLAAVRRITVDGDLVYAHLLFPSQNLVREVLLRGYRLVVCDLSTAATAKAVLQEIGDSLPRPPEALVRVRPQAANRLGYFRFGVDSAEFLEVAMALKEAGLSVVGLAIHASASCDDPKLWADSLLPLIRLAKESWRRISKSDPILNFGGGFPAAETLLKFGVNIKDYADELLKLIDGCPCKTVVIEPGRFVVSSAGFVVSEILGVRGSKDKATRRYLVIDGGSNFLIPIQSADFGFRLLGEEAESCSGNGMLVADSFSSFGVLGDFAHTQADRLVGQKMLVLNAGAYTIAMASSSGNGLPTHRFIDQAEKPEDSQQPATYFVQDAQYLEWKEELDWPLISPILGRVSDLLRGHPSIRILDVGCGTGAYLGHLLKSGKFNGFGRISYTGVDYSNDLLEAGRCHWSQTPVGVSAKFVEGDANTLSSILDGGDFDLVVGLSLLEYCPGDDVFSQLVGQVRKGGLLHLPINYDAETQFEPTFDRDVESAIMREFNTQKIPDPWCGRSLYHRALGAGLEVLDYRLDDWKIQPAVISSEGLAYSGTSELFLDRLIETIGSLRTSRRFPKSDLLEWVRLRKEQLARKELVFICRQCSILARN